MTSKLQVDNLEGRTTKGSITVTGECSGSSTNLQQGLCKAWTIYQGSASTPAPLGSLNVASITDNSAGNHSANFTNNMNDVNYAVANAAITNHCGDNDHYTNYSMITTSDNSHSQADCTRVNHAVFGDLA